MPHHSFVAVVLIVFVDFPNTFVRVSDEVSVSAGWHLEGRRLVPVLPRMLADSLHQNVASLTSTKCGDSFKAQTKRTEYRYGKHVMLLV